MKPITLTNFQKKIIECKPERNKPVFILTGRGSGVTTALEEKALREDFYIHHPNPNLKMISAPEIKNLKYTSEYFGREFLVFDHCFDVEGVLKLIPQKKIIVVTNPLDFVEKFAPKLKGEYTVVSGYSVEDNHWCGHVRDHYVNLLRSLPKKERDRLLNGVWGVTEEEQDMNEYCCDCQGIEVTLEDTTDMTSVVWYNITDGVETGGEIYKKKDIEDFGEFLEDIILPLCNSFGFSDDIVSKRVKL